jgi:hypothetical protein
MHFEANLSLKPYISALSEPIGPVLVPRMGLEPIRLIQTLDLKSRASTIPPPWHATARSNREVLAVL